MSGRATERSGRGFQWVSQQPFADSSSSYQASEQKVNNKKNSASNSYTGSQVGFDQTTGQWGNSYGNASQWYTANDDGFWKGNEHMYGNYGEAGKATTAVSANAAVQGNEGLSYGSQGSSYGVGGGHASQSDWNVAAYDQYSGQQKSSYEASKNIYCVYYVMS